MSLLSERSPAEPVVWSSKEEEVEGSNDENDPNNNSTITTNVANKDKCFGIKIPFHIHEKRGRFLDYRY